MLDGGDSLVGLRQWHRAAEIPFAANMIVASRPGESLERFEGPFAGGPEAGNRGMRADPVDRCNAVLSNRERAGRGFRFICCRDWTVEISASEIRDALRTQAQGGEADALRKLLPAPVEGYVRKHGLYH